MPRVRLLCRICGRLDGVLMDWGVVAGPQLGAGRNWCTINIANDEFIEYNNRLRREVSCIPKESSKYLICSDIES